ncbi:MoaD family protein [Acetohalobium arabaticum]|uniref:MoaD family protein n=1 Tax=Acetohalobium arabaticum TaxID=28187 RepID=UPI00031900DC|nr:MoaD family protein [Acetohalobium arabaticum]
MQINFFATFRKVTGNKQYDYQGSVENIKELLLELSDNFGTEFREMVLVGEELSPEVIILVNGINIEHLAQEETELNDKDKVSIFPVVAGG